MTNARTDPVEEHGSFVRLRRPRRSYALKYASSAAALVVALAAAAADERQPEAGGSACLPDVQVAVGAPSVFATNNQLTGYGFTFGPSDGNFGAIPAGDGKYTFIGTGGARSMCARSTSCEGAFAFSGTLDHVTGGDTRKGLFGPGDGPAGWLFDRDYAGGGQVVRFDDKQGHIGWLMSFHGEYHWLNPANPPSFRCFVGPSKSQVPCFYSGLGLALSVDNGKSFKVVGQTMQPARPLAVFTGSGTNMAVGYGSLIVADKRGRHLDNPPEDPREAYFYLVFVDSLPPGTPNAGVCAGAPCEGVARARYVDVISAVFSGDPHQVAKVFHKYDRRSPDPWTQPATSDTPDLTGTAGSFAPLWTDEFATQGSVIYDRSLNIYLAVYIKGTEAHIRASRDLIHWTGTVGVIPFPPSTVYFYPNLIGETEDPTIGSGAPRVYFTAFPVDGFPNYKLSTFEYVQLKLTGSRHPGPGCAERTDEAR